MRLKRRKERNSTCSQTTKGIARKKTSMSYIGKGAGILWEKSMPPKGALLLERRWITREIVAIYMDCGVLSMDSECP